ncbi:hypothetical protein OG866_38245 [Streptomyces sp. NBC_00663]|uniref:hypothetical protein n=1 Tax=Streptomyces sp. NBC_00663 TaxID=2975801 RepID=UPI002E31ADAA|nr:hypothetical protein [Streptomyces sp. NBC_00663]
MPRSPSPLLRTAAAVGCLALFPLTAGCGGGEEDDARKAAADTVVTAAPSAGVVAPAKVEVIAGLIGCEVKIRTEAEELREGTCHSAKGDYLITTFPEERLKLTWLDAASVYGGTYLVGTRWAVSAKEPLLKEARPRIGGTVRQLRGTSG